MGAGQSWKRGKSATIVARISGADCWDKHKSHARLALKEACDHDLQDLAQLMPAGPFLRQAQTDDHVMVHHDLWQ